MKAQMTRIADCAEVLPGYALKARAEHEPGGTVQIIMAKHIKENVPYQFISEHVLRITPKGKTGKYKVHTGDVLFLSRGVRNCAAVIQTVPQNTVASATFYILRPKKHVDPGYLAWCLNQSPIQAQISQIRTGAGTPIVQRSDFGDIQIPLPSLTEQQHIAKLGQLMNRELELRKQLVDAAETYHKSIGTQLTSKLSKT